MGDRDGLGQLGRARRGKDGQAIAGGRGVRADELGVPAGLVVAGQVGQRSGGGGR